MGGPMGGEFSTWCVKSVKWNVKYLALVHSVMEFLHDKPGVPPCWWPFAISMDVYMGVWGVSHACAHAHTCMLNMINMDASMLVAICNFYTCIHVCVCVCMCMHVGIPHAPRCPQTPPTATGSPKHQNSIHLELIEIIRFCLKILYL